MKRIFYTLALIAVAATACQKESFEPEDLGKRTVVDTATYYIIRNEYGFYDMECDRKGNATDIIKHYSSYELQDSRIFVQESKDVMDGIISTRYTLGMGNAIHTNLLRVDYNDGKPDTVNCGWYLSKHFCCRVIEDWWHYRNLKDHNIDGAVLDDKTAEAFDIVIKLLMGLDDLDSYLIVAYDRNPDDPRSSDDIMMFLKDFIYDVQGDLGLFTYMPYIYDFGVTIKKIQ